jgi:RecA/RadA recombinase
MGILNKQIKGTKADIIKKQAPGSVSETMFVATGIDLIDYNCGTVATNLADNEEFYNIGLPMGKIHMAVGHSQSGKTTILIQAAWNMAHPMNGDVILADFERSSTDPRSRVKNLTGCTDEEYDNTFTVFNQEDMTVEFLKKQLFEIAEHKRNLPPSELLDWYTLEGKPCKIYPPTILIIDSVAAMRNKELLEKADMDSNMVAATIAKGNSAFLMGVEHLLEAYNITIMAIGHITTKITINPYAEKKIQLPGLGEDENISGGNKFVYMASFVFKLKAGKEYKDDKDLGIQGRLVYCNFLKTRSGYNKLSAPLFYHGKLGFHNALTNYYHIKDTLGVLKKQGQKFYIAPAPEHTFAQKDFLTLYNGDGDFQESWNTYIAEKMGTILEAKNGASTAEAVDRNSLTEEFEE